MESETQNNGGPCEAEHVTEAKRIVDELLHKFADDIGPGVAMTMRRAMEGVISKITYDGVRVRHEFIDVLDRSVQEIEHLRRVNLEQRAESYDKIARLISFLPNLGGPSQADVTWQMRRRARELRGEAKYS